MTETPGRTRKQRGGLTKAAWNERYKLLATSLNAIGLAIFGFGALAPPFTDTATGSGVQSVACTAMSVALHLWAQWFLRWLED